MNNKKSQILPICFAFIFCFLNTCCIAQQVAFTGKIEYIGESLLQSGGYKEFVKTVTCFNETMQGDYQVNKGFDSASMVESDLANLLKQYQKNNIPLDSFEIIKHKKRIQANIEKRKQFIETNIQLRTTSYDNTISLLQVKVGEVSYCIADTFAKTKWTLLEDTMTIEGLFCQKAEGDFLGKAFEVWFAPSLPFTAGPTVMHGLPGIIVLAIRKDKKQRYQLTKLEYPLISPAEFTGCTNKKIISWKEYKELVAKYKIERQKRIEEMTKNRQ